MKRRFGANPFYVLLVAAGIVFTLTAASYFVMTLRAESLAAVDAEQDSEESGITAFLREHGAWLMAVELGLLALFCAAAMLSDDYWIRRAARRQAREAQLDRGSAQGTTHHTPDTSPAP